MSRNRPGLRRVAVAATAMAALAAVGQSSPILASTPTVTPTAYDVSYPQCGAALPAGATLGIVGVNAGRPYDVNPCLGAGDGDSELAWANSTGDPQLYANTADPGPAHSSHWPTAGATADGHECAGDNSADCSFVYGYQAATDSYQDAVTAETSLGATHPADAAAAVPWWLDVESGNSWQTSEPDYAKHPAAARANDIAVLQGAVSALRDQGITDVGLYSQPSQWAGITGGTGATFAPQPEWVALFQDATAAAGGCGPHGFGGGPVGLTQYHYGQYDADYVCPSATTLTGPPRAESGTRIALTGRTGPAAKVTLGSAGPTGPLHSVSETTASASGAFTFRVRIRQVTRFVAIGAGRRSAAVLVASNPTLLGPTRATGSSRVTVRGTAMPGDRVALRRLIGRDAKTVAATGANRRSGAYRFRLRIANRPLRLQSRDGTLDSSVLTIRGGPASGETRVRRDPRGRRPAGGSRRRSRAGHPRRSPA